MNYLLVILMCLMQVGGLPETGKMPKEVVGSGMTMNGGQRTLISSPDVKPVSVFTFAEKGMDIDSVNQEHAEGLRETNGAGVAVNLKTVSEGITFGITHDILTLRGKTPSILDTWGITLSFFQEAHGTLVESSIEMVQGTDASADGRTTPVQFMRVSSAGGTTNGLYGLVEAVGASISQFHLQTG